MDQALTDLEHCSDRLSEIVTENKVPDDELENIKSAVDDLFLVVSESNCDYQLRIAILDLLEAVRQLIAQYQIRGVAALREAVAVSLGRLFSVRESLSTPENKQLRDRVIAVLVKLDAACMKAGKYLPLLEKATKAILFLSSHGG